MKINSLKKQKHSYLNHTWLEKAFKGTVVNRAVQSLHVGSLEVTVTGPLITLIFSEISVLIYQIRCAWSTKSLINQLFDSWFGFILISLLVSIYLKVKLLREWLIDWLIN